METPKYLQTLWSYKWLLAFGVVVAAIAAFFAGFTVTNGQVESRAVKSYTAGTTVLVTSPSDTLYQAQIPGRPIEEGVTPAEPLDLSASAQIYAYIVSGARIRDHVESEVGQLDEDTETITAIRRTTQPAGDERFPGSLKLPVLEVVGTASTEDRAEEISAAATTAFLGYVEAEQTEQQIPAENRVQLEVLTEGKAVEGETSNPAIPIVITFFAVFLAFVALAFVLAAFRSRRAGKPGAQRGARGAAARSDAGPADAAASGAVAADAASDAGGQPDEHVLVGAGTRTD
ncbi:hypothetical protein [Agromyces sp. Soil535]|uniref:hypothetical protein n=1 Tax=Agromyces sp. Soil535 TaxID=1736390 RepID=UPI0006F51637|nr:hypothetical protein [Agromyces sp. Soil535]KRE25931.1 hypothetical protein ASG80_03610 [Agromyces sp. Soil535]